MGPTRGFSTVHDRLALIVFACSLQTVHDASNQAEVNRFLMAGGFMSATGRFQGVLEPSRTVGDVDVKADAPKGCIASFPEVSSAMILPVSPSVSFVPCCVPSLVALAYRGKWWIRVRNLE